MKSIKPGLRICALAMGFLLSSAMLNTAWAHCDGLDGPVVQAARHALETGNANNALIWVKHAAEAEHGCQGAGRELADRHFFETVVRVHRQDR